MRTESDTDQILQRMIDPLPNTRRCLGGGEGSIDIGIQNLITALYLRDIIS